MATYEYCNINDHPMRPLGTFEALSYQDARTKAQALSRESGTRTVQLRESDNDDGLECLNVLLHRRRQSIPDFRRQGWSYFRVDADH